MKYDVDYIEKAYRGGRSVIFDLDDTIFPEIIFLKQRYMYVTKHIFQDRWKEPYQFLVREFSTQGRSGVFDKLITRYKLTLSTNDVLTIFRCYDGGKEISITPYYWFRRLICRLKRQYPLFLITNGYPAQQREKLKALNIIDAFSDVICVYANEYKAKPSIQPFEVLEKKVQVHHPIYIGDSTTDMAFCLACGIEFFQVKNLMR